MKKLFLFLTCITLFCSCENSIVSNEEFLNYKNQKNKTIDSLQTLLNKARQPQYYETGWTLIKINGSLNEEKQDSTSSNFNTFGLYRLFDNLPGLEYKIIDIELGGSCTSFEPGHKLYIISKSPF